VRWETEWSFDGKLCQEYSYQNSQNLLTGFQVTVENVRDVFFETQCIFTLYYDYYYFKFLFVFYINMCLFVNAVVAEPIMPATLPLPSLFHIRPVYMVTEDEDDRLSNIYWLSTPMGDESDHEQDLVYV